MYFYQNPIYLHSLIDSYYFNKYLEFNFIKIINFSLKLILKIIRIFDKHTETS